MKSRGRLEKITTTGGTYQRIKEQNKRGRRDAQPPHDGIQTEDEQSN